MSYALLASGYRESISLLSFEPSSAKLKTVSESKAPELASWIEPSTTKPKSILYSTSEVDKGEVFSLSLIGEEVSITSKVSTQGEHPCHNGSGIVAANYTGGQIVYFPTNEDGTFDISSASTPLVFDWPYEGKKAPNTERQDKTHAHQVIEDDKGNLYACDLGSDRVWVVKRDGATGLKVVGYLQCPPGSGPRHGVFASDFKHLYVLTEMGHSVFVFSLDDPSYPAHPLPDVEVNIVPQDIPKEAQTFMDSAEIIINPTISGVLYASNRLQLHIKEKNPGKTLPELPDVKGDAIAVILLSPKGDKIESVKTIQTELDGIRGMQISKDGKYLAAAGQEGGGVDIYAIGGSRGDELKLAAKDESITKVTDFVWL